MTDPRWYYAEDGAEHGPVDQVVFDDLVEAGEIRSDTPVWREGMSKWRPAGEELAAVGAIRPPPHAGWGQVGRGDHQGGQNGEGDFLRCVREGFRRYFDFRGRSNRPEFWWFTFAVLVIGLVIGAVDAAIFGGDAMDTGPVGVVWSIGTFIPSLALGVRRLHDYGRSGWWLLLLLLPIIGWLALLYFYVQPGEPRRNAWG